MLKLAALVMAICLMIPATFAEEVGPVSVTAPVASLSAPLTLNTSRPEIPMQDELWRYLRKGLNYLEASGREYPTTFVHPGGVAYGSLALTKVAIRDVLDRTASMSRYTVEDVLSNPAIYEEAARLYADLLLRHYLKVEYWKMPKEEVFRTLEKAWFWGPGLYRKGSLISGPRQKRAEEYIYLIS
jgi:hypothetical protein